MNGITDRTVTDTDPRNIGDLIAQPGGHMTDRDVEGLLCGLVHGGLLSMKRGDEISCGLWVSHAITSIQLVRLG